MTDYISTLKKMLSDELERVANDSFGREYSKWNKEEKRPFNYNESFRHGHEAATERLLPLIEMYEETLTAIDWHIRQMQNEKLISMKEMCRALKVISDNYKAREFLAKIKEMK